MAKNSTSWIQARPKYFSLDDSERINPIKYGKSAATKWLEWVMYIASRILVYFLNDEANQKKLTILAIVLQIF